MKRWIALMLMLVIVLAMTGCGNNTKESELPVTPEPTAELIQYIPIEKYVFSGVEVENTVSGKSFTWCCPVDEAIATFSDLHTSTNEHSASYNDGSNSFMNADIAVDDFVDGRGNTEGYIDDIFAHSEEWVLNGFLRVGTSKDDVVNNLGEPQEDGGYVANYYFEDPVLNSYKITIYYNTETNTVESYGVHNATTDLPGFTDFAYQVPQYVAEGYFTIVSCYTTEPNSADGVDFVVSFTNDSDRRIKYFIITATPYNAVDDVVFSQIGDESTKDFELVGPIEPHSEVQLVERENAWYSANIKYPKIERIKIIYMDGNQETLYFAPSWK